MYKKIERFLTKNPCYKENKKITVKGIMLHSVGCAQPSAMALPTQVVLILPARMM